MKIYGVYQDGIWTGFSSKSARECFRFIAREMKKPLFQITIFDAEAEGYSINSIENE